MTTTNVLHDGQGTLCEAGDLMLVPGELVGESADVAVCATVLGLNDWGTAMVRVELTNGQECLLDSLAGCQLVTSPWERLVRRMRAREVRN